ncbi:DeoR family transcriptional regulator [Brevibacillus reuszeri]|uniref:DNA-binding protein n=1 Tax=Brevibacillus reuszeri TaxID=54915 RepID=A0A0K9YXS4_9BACL|nr:YafY family protein [Brevibacillus reuszeri]KNB73488.1 DNA-binding protein [Brevibacillus reuszeri]MED1858719.1 YafY family protein [Brevibacillus reuszeri]GED69699.1 DeoR family transcriptional regulator [Brevibacillus reuszeri]
MSKSKRLLELMLTVNRKRKFTAGELAYEFGVSTRTILRDLQELSELGVPLYSEVGPHGGYQVLKERILPPIAFSEEEAVAIFFAIHALRHYSSLPFSAEASSALKKFTQFMSQDIRDRIEQMKNRVDFITPTRQASSPYLSVLLEAAIQQRVLCIDYESTEKRADRLIQPIGIYTRNGLWYCRAYCFQNDDIRVFRCDRIHSAVPSDTKPRDLWHMHLDNSPSHPIEEQEQLALLAELTKTGVQACEAEPGLAAQLHIRKDGTGWLEGSIAKRDLLFFAKFFIGAGKDATVKHPPELLDCMKSYLSELSSHYSFS